MPPAAAPAPALELLPGISAGVAEINGKLRQYAASGAMVFLTGEGGTEKALAAKIYHSLSPRSSKPMGKLVVSWKLPPDMAQHVEKYAKGTLVIVIQREFPIDMQYTLVEMAAHGAFTDPMSGETHECPDIGIVLLTSLATDKLLNNRTGALLPELRELLQARHIHVPPLRERPEDIPALVRYAIRRTQETGRSKVLGADAQVLALFRHHRWPNNAEDLLLVTAQAALAAKADLIGLDDLPEEFLAQILPEELESARQVKLPTPVRRQAGGAIRPIARADAPLPPYPLPYKHDEEEDTDTSALSLPTPLTVSPATHIDPRESRVDIPIPNTRLDISMAPTRVDLSMAPTRVDLPDMGGIDAKTPIMPYHDVPPRPAAEPPPRPRPEPARPAAASTSSVNIALRPTAPDPRTQPKDDPNRDSKVNDSGEFALPSRLLRLARRLGTQSDILAQQMNGPLAAFRPKDQPLRSFDNRTEDEKAMLLLEAELERGLDMVLSLRRQLAKLNQHRSESLLTFRDLLQRLQLEGVESMRKDPGTTAEATEIATRLHQVNEIIEKVSQSLPEVGAQLQRALHETTDSTAGEP